MCKPQEGWCLACRSSHKHEPSRPGTARVPTARSGTGTATHKGQDLSKARPQPGKATTGHRHAHAQSSARTPAHLHTANNTRHPDRGGGVLICQGNIFILYHSSTIIVTAPLFIGRICHSLFIPDKF